ncbi:MULTISPECIES: DUF4331 domain-containing protein [Marinobacter]|uniref:DUF4331 domain-containing protein n=1 Tax=Marinobacter TaxID=2742 RepID=UPI001C9639EC|nr:DUF4331 domain-containing protein [Marinobacter nauticus]MBY5937192.1 DUF4331 domain-containing protein [Marinobacter nauticus]MBY5954565.1 DUF4331 domain-containing protein [Marinobacter nauticus]MBY5962673.1 DUF4331 domain-containing protein [Marinobacter nauticus]MBY6008213.1 DUF4331 domain-containing protein [Marinobacter nauticus]MBY6101888.1 DUF4331 domain-containing protein [Marinobacter nauticus]
MTKRINRSGLALAIAGTCLAAATAQASSHREAPFITELPKADATDFYMFRSYETGRDGFVTLIANYLPLQDAYGGPNYFDLDEDAIYEIHIDNTGNAREDLTFQFQVQDIMNDIQLNVGGEMVSVPLKNVGDATDNANVQMRQEYTVTVIRGDRRMGTRQVATNATTGMETFAKPLDNIGGKSFGDYQAYANQHIFDIAIPGCSSDGRVFVGQRKEAFAVNLGEIFDLVNTNPVGPRNGEGAGDLADKNVTSFALEVPTACLTGTAQTASGDPVIGGWTTASVRQARVINPAPDANGKGATVEGGAYVQVSRLGMPLVNEVVIGLKDKDRFNASEPVNDGQFLTYVTNPTLPALLEALFGVTAPTNFPRNDLVTAFLTGVPDLNGPDGVTASEMLRLNPGIAPTAAGAQNDLGVLGMDNAGFPNGRRPVDDTVDISLRVAMGVLADPADAPSGDLEYTDGVQLNPAELQDTFPYLATPIAGSPNGL